MAEIIDFGRDENGRIVKRVTRQDGLSPEAGQILDDAKAAAASDVPSRKRERSAATVVRLKLAGASYAEIAEVMEYDSPGRARYVFEGAIASSGEHDVDYKMLRTIANAQLDGLMKSVAPIALDNKHPDHLAYFRAALSVIDRKARLNGLDAPVRLELSTPGAAEFEAVVNEATKAIGGGPIEPDIFEMVEGEDGVTWQRSDDTEDVQLLDDDHDE